MLTHLLYVTDKETDEFWDIHIYNMKNQFWDVGCGLGQTVKKTFCADYEQLKEGAC